ncbi:hypothetical protein E2C01_019884 [Portunus trituberculatus]|uniref:Uncharacterized protein n=1 Tax=Portunus trituberculatus TaxID=210409 RepID=A0A5B7E078_PORTR|nr:hypothetical protein [Portunus trituberculatus]
MNQALLVTNHLAAVAQLTSRAAQRFGSGQSRRGRSLAPGMGHDPRMAPAPATPGLWISCQVLNTLAWRHASPRHRQHQGAGWYLDDVDLSMSRLGQRWQSKGQAAQGES